MSDLKTYFCLFLIGVFSSCIKPDPETSTLEVSAYNIITGETVTDSMYCDLWEEDNKTGIRTTIYSDYFPGSLKIDFPTYSGYYSHYRYNLFCATENLWYEQAPEDPNFDVFTPHQHWYLPHTTIEAGATEKVEMRLARKTWIKLKVENVNCFDENDILNLKIHHELENPEMPFVMEGYQGCYQGEEVLIELIEGNWKIEKTVWRNSVSNVSYDSFYIAPSDTLSVNIQY